MEIGYTAAALIGSVLGGSAPLPAEALDYDALYRFANAHSVVPLIAYALKKADLLPPEQRSRFANDLHVAMAMEATQEYYLQSLSEAFREKQIKFMPLKGCVMKHLYPQPFLRTMCDIDIQYDPARKKEVHEIMLAKGLHFEEASGTDGVNVSYRKPPYLHVEMHGVLMDADVPLYHSYFGQCFERTVPKNGSEVMFGDEDFFVFMTAHMAKHYFSAGTGLRSVADLWLYLKKKPELNRDYIFDELKKIELDEFLRIILGAAGVLFDGKPADETLQAVCRYIFDSQTYGTTAHYATRQADSSHRSDYVKKRLFPDAEFMAINYPVVKKCRLLLPLFWLIRLFSVVFTGRGKHNDVTAVLSSSRQMLDARTIPGKPVSIADEKFYVKDDADALGGSRKGHNSNDQKKK